MSRVLEIVLCLSLDAWQVKTGSRARGEPRDFGAELVRAWRICPQVRMRRGHERVTIEPCQVEEAEPSPGECWWTWIESNAQGRRVVASRTKAFAPGVMARERFDAEHAGIAVATPPSAPAPRADAESAPATGAGADTTPGPVDEAAVAASSGPAQLRLVTERRRGRWADDSGVVVEMTLDDVTLHGGAELPRRQVELRLAAPDWETVPARTAALRALFAAARELSGAWPAFVQLTSVIDRACAGEPGVTGPVKAKIVDLTGIRTQRTALFALSGDIAAQWLGNEGGVLDRDDPEFVHQMRVALRRLRTLMRFFPRFAGDQWQETFGVDLRWLASLLGTVRDWDVFSTESLPALIAADGGSADWNGTLDAARAQATAARTELRQALHSARYARLTLGWLEWLSTLALPPAAGRRRRRRAVAAATRDQARAAAVRPSVCIAGAHVARYGRAAPGADRREAAALCARILRVACLAPHAQRNGQDARARAKRARRSERHDGRAASSRATGGTRVSARFRARLRCGARAARGARRRGAACEPAPAEARRQAALSGARSL